MTDTLKLRPAKPPVPAGIDNVLNLKRRDGKNLPISYWDLWFLLVAETTFNGDLNLLAQHLRDARNGWHRDDAVRKLNHLRDLQQRLEDAGITLTAALAAANSDLVKIEKRRAAGRILNHNERQHERSDPMLNPPEKRLYAFALRGMWQQFPVSPEPYAKRLASRFNWSKYHGENASFGLARKLDSETDSAKKLADKGSMNEALAVLRSLMTVTLELIETADDSFGAIGDSFQSAFKLYLDLFRRQTGVKPEIFLTDLLEFLIWEDYGLTYEQTDGFFKRLTKLETDFSLDYLRVRITNLQAIDLDHQAKEALDLLGQIIAEQKRFDAFEPLAKDMAANGWQEIIRLADVAVKAGKQDLAEKVFLAAMTQGTHIDFLRKKYEQLISGKWNPDPKK